MKRVQYLYENNNGGQFKEMHFTTKEGLEGSVKTWMVWMEIDSIILRGKSPLLCSGKA